MNKALGTNVIQLYFFVFILFGGKLNSALFFGLSFFN